MRGLFRDLFQAAVLLTLFVIPTLGSQPIAFAQDEKVSSVNNLSLSELQKGIADRLDRVEEFKFIQEEAKKLGVRAWLFGGTAAGYAHYVKWDMQREKGDSRFQKDRFDYDYTNIYRSTQDLDIVIDGDPAHAQKLQNALQERYPHLQGSKTAWEVRLLTQDMGDKLAILNNPDFLNQHTDSNSTGMVEITPPKAGESVVRDVRDWDSKEPHFLKDIHEGKLHYYYSLKHAQTKFAKEGRNPPILSVIRYLTKAFQYELELRPEDLAQVQKIINEFVPTDVKLDSYVANWIEKNGKKLIQNAVNIEYARNTLDRLGLRIKLEAVNSGSWKVDTLAWWMVKEPLRTSEVGLGHGKTAKELGLDIVAHETNNFLAYESITRAHTGDANVLISRGNAAGEAAAYGDGFYTKIGRQGARGTGMTIRFHLDPNAREGTDFTRTYKENFVIVKNKAALKVIQESLDLGPVEYFQILDRGSSGVGAGDLAILEKFRRRMGAKLHSLSDSELDETVQIVEKHLNGSKPGQFSDPVISTWFSMPVSTRRPELLLKYVQSEEWGNIDSLHALRQSHWRMKHPELVAVLFNRQMEKRPARKLEAKLLDGVRVDTERVNNIQKDLFLAEMLADPASQSHPEWIEGLVKKGTVDESVALNALTQPHWRDRPELVETLLDRKSVSLHAMAKVLSQPHWGDHPELMLKFINQNRWGRDFPGGLFSLPHWKAHPEILEAWVNQQTKRRPVRKALSIINRNFNIFQDFNTSALDAEWRKDSDLVRSFALPGSESHPEWVEALIKKGSIDHEIRTSLLSQPHWKNQPELRRLAGGADPTVENLRQAFKRGESVRVSANGIGKCVIQKLKIFF